MRKVFLVFLVLGLIFAAGCNSPVSLDKDGGIVIKGEDGEKVKIGEDGLEFTGEDGSESVISSGDDLKLPDGYPSNIVPLMKGGKITWSNKSTEDNKSTYWITAEYNKKAEEVIKFYQDKLADMEEVSSQEIPDYYSLNGKKDGYNIIISVTTNDDNTTLSIIITPESD